MMHLILNTSKQGWLIFWKGTSKIVSSVLDFSCCQINRKLNTQPFTHQTTQCGQFFSTVSKLFILVNRFGHIDLWFSFLLQNGRYFTFINNHIRTGHLSRKASNCTRTRDYGHLETRMSKVGQLLRCETEIANFMTHTRSYNDYWGSLNVPVVSPYIWVSCNMPFVLFLNLLDSFQKQDSRRKTIYCNWMVCTSALTLHKKQGTPFEETSHAWLRNKETSL